MSVNQMNFCNGGVNQANRHVDLRTPELQILGPQFLNGKRSVAWSHSLTPHRTAAADMEREHVVTH